MSHNPGSRPAASTATRLAVVAACLLAGALLLSQTFHAEERPAVDRLDTLPMTLEMWKGRKDPDFDQNVVQVLGADDYVLRTYAQRGTLPVGLYIGYYATQTQADTIHSPLNCLPGAGWSPLERGEIAIPVQRPDGDTVSITTNRVVVAKGEARSLVLYWYQSPRRVIANEYMWKVYTVLDSVRYHRTDAALVRVIVPIPDARLTPRAEQVAMGFVQSIYPFLVQHFPA